MSNNPSPVPREEVALLKRGNYDEAYRGAGFTLYRRSNEIIMLSDEPANNKLWEWENPTKAHEVFAGATHKPLMIEVPAAE